jgi:hypothetical protein
VKPINHICAAALGGAGILSFGGGWQTASAFSASTVLLDLDHVVDHWLFSVEPPTVKNFFRRGSPAYWKRIVFPLHSHELFLTAAFFLLSANLPVCTAIFWGYALHLAMDEIGNRLPGHPVWLHPLFYFFTFRLLHRFRPLSLTLPKGV